MTATWSPPGTWPDIALVDGISERTDTDINIRATEIRSPSIFSMYSYVRRTPASQRSADGGITAMFTAPGVVNIC